MAHAREGGQGSIGRRGCSDAALFVVGAVLGLGLAFLVLAACASPERKPVSRVAEFAEGEQLVQVLVATDGTVCERRSPTTHPQPGQAVACHWRE